MEIRGLFVRARGFRSLSGVGAFFGRAVCQFMRDIPLYRRWLAGVRCGRLWQFVLHSAGCVLVCELVRLVDIRADRSGSFALACRGAGWWKSD